MTTTAAIASASYLASQCDVSTYIDPAITLAFVVITLVLTAYIIFEE